MAERFSQKNLRVRPSSEEEKIVIQWYLPGKVMLKWLDMSIVKTNFLKFVILKN